MNDIWSRSQFKRDLENLLNFRPPIGMSKIEALRHQAIQHSEYQNFIVQSIVSFIQKAPPDYRIAGLYLINEIVRRPRVAEEERRVADYRRRFVFALRDGALDNLFDPCIPEDKARVERLLNYWRDKGICKKELIDRIRRGIMSDGTDRETQGSSFRGSPPNDGSTQAKGFSSTADAAHTTTNPDPGVTANSKLHPALVHFLTTMGFDIDESLLRPAVTPRRVPRVIPATGSPAAASSSSSTPEPVVDIPSTSAQSQGVSNEDRMSLENTTLPFSSPTRAIIASPSLSSIPPDCKPLSDPNCSQDYDDANVYHTPLSLPVKCPDTPPRIPDAQFLFTHPVATYIPRGVPPPKTPPRIFKDEEDDDFGMSISSSPSCCLLRSSPSEYATNETRSLTENALGYPASLHVKQHPLTSPGNIQDLDGVFVAQKIDPDESDADMQTSPALQAITRIREPMTEETTASTLQKPISPPVKADLPISSGDTGIQDLDMVFAAQSLDPDKSDTALPSLQPTTRIPENVQRDIYQDSAKSKSTGKNQTSGKRSKWRSRWDLGPEEFARVKNSTTGLSKSSQTADEKKKSDIEVENLNRTRESRPKKDNKQNGGATRGCRAPIKDSGKDHVADLDPIKYTDKRSAGLTREIDLAEKKSAKPASKGPSSSRNRVSIDQKENGCTDAKRNSTNKSVALEARSFSKESSVERPEKSYDKEHRFSRNDDGRQWSDRYSDTATKSSVDTERPYDKAHRFSRNNDDRHWCGQCSETVTTTKRSANPEKPLDKAHPFSRNNDDRQWSDRRTDTTMKNGVDVERPHDIAHRFSRNDDDRQWSDRRRETVTTKAPMIDRVDNRSSDQRWRRVSETNEDKIRGYEHRVEGLNNSNSEPTLSPYARPGPVSDSLLPVNTIRVLSRTLCLLFVPRHVNPYQIRDMLSAYGEVISVTIVPRSHGSPTAFVQLGNRSSAQSIIDNADRISLSEDGVKISWGHSFGPKSLFNYERGESVLHLEGLTIEELDLLSSSTVGGFQGSKIRDRVIVEEPGPASTQNAERCPSNGHHRYETTANHHYHETYQPTDSEPPPEYDTRAAWSSASYYGYLHHQADASYYSDDRHYEYHSYQSTSWSSSSAPPRWSHYEYPEQQRTSDYNAPYSDNDTYAGGGYYSGSRLGQDPHQPHLYPHYANYRR